MLNLKMIFVSLSSLLLTTAAYAGTTATCTGTLVVAVGVDGPDKISAVQARFTLNMKDDKTATMTLEGKNQAPMIGSGQETENEDVPWSLSAKDEDGLEFTGNLTAVKALSPKDTSIYMILELKSSAAVISGPMACEFGATPE